MLYRLVLVLLLVICYPVFSTELPVSGSNNYQLIDIRSTGISLNLGDDSVSDNIPLGFSFNLFGKTFDSVWVSNNGVISFTNGNISGYNSASLNTLISEYNYALFPLWTDLINSGTNNPHYRLDSGTAIFGWYGISEYADRNKRSTFEVQLWNDSSFQFRYESINLSRSPFTIGYTGDISAGEYTQWARHPGGTYTDSNFGFYSSPIDQCVINPLYSIDCSGYLEAYTNQQCAINPLYSSSCTGYEAAMLEQNCGSNPLYSTNCPGYTAAIFEQNCNKDPLHSSQCPGYVTAFGQQIAKSQNTSLSEISQNTAIIVEDSTKYETTTDVGGVELSVTGEIFVVSDIPDVVRSVEKSKQTSVVGIDPRTLEIIKNILKTENEIINLVFDNTNYSLIESTRFDRNYVESTIDTFTNSNTNNTENRSQLFALSTESNNTLSEYSTERKTERTFNTSSQMSELGDGANFSELTYTIPGFNSYTSIQLRDVPFYPSRDIYRGQVNVDNSRAQRGLSGSNNITYQRMIEQQYNLGN
jgi:hypothetical protein